MLEKFGNRNGVRNEIDIPRSNPRILSTNNLFDFCLKHGNGANIYTLVC